MPTREELETQYKAEHDRITKAYYLEHSLSKAGFDMEHAALWQQFETDMKAIGALPPPLPQVDWKALWSAADTTDKKLAVLAKRLELE